MTITQQPEPFLVRVADALGTGNIDHRISQVDLSDAAVAEPFAAPVADIDTDEIIARLDAAFPCP